MAALSARHSTWIPAASTSAFPTRFSLPPIQRTQSPLSATIQTDSHVFRRVVAELVATLNAPFILFGPTSDYFDARSQSLLSRVKAAFFSLDAHVILKKQGAFQATKPPGELFASFRPDRKNTPGEDVARQTLALAKALDGQYKFRKAPLYTVFLLYCSECLSVNEIAKHCRCHRCIVFVRLKLLHQKLGRHPSQLRQCIWHFEKIEESINDPRAKKISRKDGLTGNKADD